MPLYVEYQDVLLRPGTVAPTLTPDDIVAFCRYLASISHLQKVYYLWRPHLVDPGDDMVFEVAAAAQAQYIVTHNVRDFIGAGEFGITAIKPADFLALIRHLK